MKLDPQDAYHLVFWNECHDHIFEIEKALLELESSQPSDQLVHHIFRMAHSIKGSAATIGVEDMVTLSHAMEEVFTRLRASEIKLTLELINSLFMAVDFLKMQHAALMSDYFEWPEIAPLIQELSQNTTHKTNVDIQVLKHPYVIVIDFINDAELLSVKTYMIVEALNPVGTIVDISPADYEDLEDDAFSGRVQVAMDEHTDDQAVLNALSGISDITYKIVKTSSDTPQSAQLSSPEPQTTKVSNRDINALFGYSRKLYQSLENLIALKNEIASSSKTLDRFEDIITTIESIADGMQATVMSTRSLPVSVLFDKYPRLVRDLAAEFGKNVRLECEGDNQSIDKSVIEALSDPLTHLIRNAIDHGFEDEATRLQNGKPQQGTLKLSARQTHAEVIFVVEDDGKGISIELIQQKALSKGFVTFEEMSYMSNSDWIDLLFVPGFTTTDFTTTISGRGVGLDVVKSNLIKLNGQIEVTSQEGKGTRFEIKLPLTLAVSKAIILKSGDCFYALPFTSILELVRVKANQWISKTEYSQTFYWNDQNIPFVFLNTLFDTLPSAHSHFYVAIVRVGERSIALGVDRVLGDHNIAISPMTHLIGQDKVLGNIPFISGAALLRLGSLAYCLDPFAIAKAINR